MLLGVGVAIIFAALGRLEGENPQKHVSEICAVKDQKDPLSRKDACLNGH